MKLTCPNCGEDLSLAALIEHDASREAIMLALQFPAPLGKLLVQYVKLFKPAQRALSMDRFSAILGELLPMVTNAKVSKNGNIYAAPQSYWVDAINNMVTNKASLTLPIKTHGYLISIIVGYADKSSAQAEKKSEQGRKYGAIKESPKQAVKSKPRSIKQTLDNLNGKTNHAE